MFNGKSFNEKFLLTRKYYDFERAINCTCKLTCMRACACACDHTHLREQYDNYFDSIPLMKHLKQEGIGCTGALRANMLQDCPLLSKAMFKKEKKCCYKGYIDEESGVILAMWKNNGPVTVGSNSEAIKPLGIARRWSKEDKDYIGVPRPALIGSYNMAMGGTYQMDQAISTYQPFVCNRKWYWPPVLFGIISIHNSWLLYCISEKECPFLEHVQSIATSYLNLHHHDRRVFHTEETMFKNSQIAKRVDPAV